MSMLASGTLLAAAIALGAALVVLLLYLLRPPARRLLVPSSLIWERVLRANRRRDDRLRWLLSLLLAAAIAALIALAASGPKLPGAAGSERIVLVVDNSPTMTARTSDGSTRFELARARALALLEAAGPASQVLVADTMRRIPIPAFEQAQAARARLDSLEVGFGEQPAVPVAAITAEARARYAITDGVQLRRIPEGMTAVSVFEPVENVGITAFDVQPVPGAPQRYQAFVEMSNTGALPANAVLSLTGLGGARVERSVSLAAGSSQRELIDVSGFDGGPLRAALLMPGDGLALDDEAYGFLPIRREVRVLLVTQSNAFLEKSLAAQPRVRLRVVSPQGYADRGDTDVIVFDRYSPRAAPLAPALLVRPGRVAWLPERGVEVARPKVARWDGDHPLLENVSLRELYIEKAAPARAAADGPRPLAATATGAPLMLVQHGTRRWVSLAFALEDSNFALQPGFPVFLNNAISWLAGEPPAQRAGLGPVALPASALRVIGVDGAEVPMFVAAGVPQVDATRPGVYTVFTPRERTRIAVSLLDARLSEVNRSALPAVEPVTVQPVGAALPFGLWRWLLLAALLLLVVEWFTYNRRLTV